MALYSTLISDDQGLPVSDIDGRRNLGRCSTKAATLHPLKDHLSNSRNDPALLISTQDAHLGEPRACVQSKSAAPLEKVPPEEK
jgi:hypothetical protein